MRKVSKEIAEAFMKNENKRMGNTIIHPVSEWMTKNERGVFLTENFSKSAK